VSALNKPHNVDFTAEKENRKPKSRKEKSVPSEWKRHKTKLLRISAHKNRTFKRCTDITERKTVPLWGHW